MIMYLFSKTTLGFYPEWEKQSYINAGSLPDDVIEVEDEIRDIYNAQPPAGKILSADDKGMPVWADKPQAELVSDAEWLRSIKTDEANAYINSKQWPGKAALGRLKGDDLTQYGLWLDYLDALEAVDISTAPEVNWPVKPE
nr:tail fiber assembly protein [Kosakonia radicincitans]